MEFRELFDVAFVEERAASDDYVSRDAIIDDVEAALADPGCRIVALKGKPGAGKTTLMAALALRHPEWPRYFIRRAGEPDIAAANHGGHDGGLASFLTTVGLQLAAVRPDLFPEEADDHLDIELVIDHLGAGASAHLLRIERLLLHPFRRFAARVRASAGLVEGNLVGVCIGEIGHAAAENPLALVAPALIAPLERLRREAAGERVVVLLDGLDELRVRDAPFDVSKWLNEYTELHPNLRLVVASRENDDRLRALSVIHGRSFTALDASRNAEPDVRGYAGKVAVKPHVRRILGEYGVQPEEFARRAAAKAGVVFQYVAFLDRALTAVAGEGQRPTDLNWLAAPVDEWPNGPGELYAKFMIRVRDQVRRVTLTHAAWDTIYLPLLGLLAVAYLPLTSAQLAAYAGISDEHAEAVATTCEAALARLSQFVTGDPESGHTLVHRSVADYILGSGAESGLGLDEGVPHRRVTEYAFGRYRADRSWKAADAYLRTFLAAHAAAVGQLDDLVEDPWFLVAAAPEELLATLENAVRAARVAAVYRRVAPDLKRGDEGAALAHLELAAREAGLGEFAAAVAAVPGGRPWTAAWTRRGRIPVSGVVGRHEGGITAIAVTPADVDGGGPLALTAGNDGRIRIWDPRRHAEAAPPLTPPESDSKITALAAGTLRSGEAFAVAGTVSGLVRAWNVATSEPVCPPLVGMENAGFPIAVCALGGGQGASGFAALCEGLDNLRLWDVTRGVPLGPPVRLGGTLDGAVVRSFGARLLTAIVAPAQGSDESVRVFDAATWRPVGPWLGPGDEAVTAVALEEHEGKPVVVVRDISLGVQVFDAETGTPWRKRDILWHDDADVVAAGRLNDELLFASAGRSGVIRLRRLGTGAPFAEVTAFEDGRVLALAIAGGQLVAAGVDYAGGQRRPVLLRWACSPGHGFRQVSAVPAPAELTGFAEVPGPDGAVTVACCDGRRLYLADAGTGQVRGPALFGTPERVRAIAAARLDDGTPVAVAGVEKTIRVWDLERGMELCPPVSAPTVVNALAVTRLNGALAVVSSCWRGGVQVWDLAAGRPAGSTLPAVPEYTESMAVAVIGGRPLVLAGAKGEITGYDLATGELAGGLPLPAFAQPLGLEVLDDTAGGGAVVVAATPLAGGIASYNLGPHDRLAGQQPRAISVPDDLAALAVTRIGGQPAALCAGREGNLQIIDLTGDPAGSDEGPVLGVALARVNGEPVVVCAGERDVRVLSLAVGEQAAPSPVGFRPSRITRVAVVDIDGHAVGVCSTGYEIHLWHLDSGAAAGVGRISTRERIECITTGRLKGRPVVVAGCFDVKTRVYDLLTGEEACEPVETPLSRPFGVAMLSADPAILFLNFAGAVQSRYVGLESRTLTAEEFEALLTTKGPGFSAEEETPPAPWRVGPRILLHRRRTDADCYSLALGVLDGTPVILTGHGDGEIDIFTIETALPVGPPLTGHESEVSALAFAEFGGRPLAASGGRDGTVRVWDLAAGSVITSVRTAAMVHGVALHPPDYCVIVTASGALAVRFTLPAPAAVPPPSRIPVDVRAARACPEHTAHVTTVSVSGVDAVRMCVKGIHLPGGSKKQLDYPLGHCYVFPDRLMLVGAGQETGKPPLEISFGQVYIEAEDVPHAYEYDGGHFRVNIEDPFSCRSLCFYRRSERDFLARHITGWQQQDRGR